MTQEDLQTEIEEVMLVPFDLLELEGASESTRAKTAETFLELLTLEEIERVQIGKKQ